MGISYSSLAGPHHHPKESQEYSVFPKDCGYELLKFLGSWNTYIYTTFTHVNERNKWVLWKTLPVTPCLQNENTRKEILYNSVYRTLVKGNWQFYNCLTWSSLLWNLRLENYCGLFSPPLLPSSIPFSSPNVFALFPSLFFPKGKKLTVK